ncbi:uncharacterized protein LOC135367289 [Ornithodoros turicata]|uniref:uncharacterized protein LOC135367289 n=1 Tax=Ornithodoros turicata TaxID=34597 RepID=UPI0031388B67
MNIVISISAARTLVLSSEVPKSTMTTGDDTNQASDDARETETSTSTSPIGQNDPSMLLTALVVVVAGGFLLVYTVITFKEDQKVGTIRGDPTVTDKESTTALLKVNLGWHSANLTGVSRSTTKTTPNATQALNSTTAPPESSSTVNTMTADSDTV